MRASPARRRGYTLTEVMIAFLVLIFGALSAALFLGSITRAGAFTQHATIAGALAADKIDSLQAGASTSLTGGTDTVENFYQRQWSLVTATSGAQLVTVTVTWGTAGGGDKAMTVYSAITD